ncbi:Gfo/Idh/MocA family oxidoreductase [Deinococcus planocerae]|uniref:Gfo/Idh/MocA family oxidoreductase n=1 Tax=Deinococcus planocerae TaxID=1737569 RepID=UPI000C7F4F04|nr:Gfo/Idh/MocA family oxidoreductase [Deinococcus planocerae]
MPESLRVAIVGTAARSDSLYGPIVKALPGHVTLVGVWGRSEASARRLGESLGVPHFTDLNHLIRETGAQLGIVSVAYGANGQVGRMAVEHGLHVLLETPIAHDLREADAIIGAALERGLKVEVAEQFHRRPLEQIKLKLIESGVFGRVHSSFSDFAGHGYHGVSVMRSYLGFDTRPVRVVGMVRDYRLAPHWSFLADTRGERTETQEHALVEFEDGRLGVFHWTSVGYDSPLRWWRSSRFLAEKGMGLTVGMAHSQDERLTLLTPDGEAPQFITLERRLERNDGGALRSIVAHTGDPEHPTVIWENPFVTARKGHNPQWHDDEIAVAGCLLSLVDAVRTGGEPTYGGEQARLDQEIVLAMQRSSREGGQPVELPLER